MFFLVKFDLAKHRPYEEMAGVWLKQNSSLFAPEKTGCRRSVLINVKWIKTFRSMCCFAEFLHITFALKGPKLFYCFSNF